MALEIASAILAALPAETPTVYTIPTGTVRKYLDEYEFRFDGGAEVYTPTEHEFRLLEDFGNGLLGELPVALPVDKPDAEAIDPVAVNDASEDDKGLWRSCSGCHELDEGYPTGRYSKALSCHVGLGCRECGGIGAVWDMLDYAEMADYLSTPPPSIPPKTEAVRVKPLEWVEEIKDTWWTTDAYRIEVFDGGGFAARVARPQSRAFLTLAHGISFDEAKAAAQADYERRILSALASPEGE